MIICDIYVITT